MYIPELETPEKSRRRFVMPQYYKVSTAPSFQSTQKPNRRSINPLRIDCLA